MEAHTRMLDCVDGRRARTQVVAAAGALTTVTRYERQNARGEWEPTGHGLMLVTDATDGEGSYRAAYALNGQRYPIWPGPLTIDAVWSLVKGESYGPIPPA
jgi:hypothetical protein